MRSVPVLCLRPRAASNTRWLPDGVAQGSEVGPSCSKTTICGRAGSTGLPLLRLLELLMFLSRPGASGVLGPDRYLAAGR